MEQEYKDFCAMLDALKEDHKTWAKELEQCIQKDVPFSLATDHHLCTLGKWRDSFRSNNSVIMSHLSKLDEPHERFHAAAHRYNECKKHHTDCGQNDLIIQDVEAARSNYMPLILKILDEAKDVFLSSYQAIVIILEGEQGTLGLIADRVLSVETVIPIDKDQSSSYFSQTRFISGIGKGEKSTTAFADFKRSGPLRSLSGLSALSKG